MLELLDNLNVLTLVQFAAASIDRLPRYGPNEINVCSVADKQAQVDQEITEIKGRFHDETSKCNNQVAQLAAACDKANETLVTQLAAMTDNFNGRMQQLEVICSNIHSSILSANNSATATQSGAASTSSAEDRAKNIIVFGLAEDRNRTGWYSTIKEALQHVAGRTVDVADAFRIGKYNANQLRPRPVIVKLRSGWDRRLVLSSARKLAEKAEFRRIGFAPDEPAEIRRQKTMKRLLLKATKDGKQALLLIMVYILMAICFSLCVTALFAIMLLLRIITTTLMDDHDHSRLRVTSYNCHGFNYTKIPYMATLLSECEFFFIQEHWLADCQLQKLNTVCNTHNSYGTSGFEPDEFIKGRPYGSCAIFWQTDLNAQIYFVPTHNRRICSIRVSRESFKLLLINVYMPY
jgi:hypothetical protein